MKIEALKGRNVAGRFTLRSLLGEGGMATVWIAEQAGEPREIALKIMNEELTSDRMFVKRFKREAEAASAVRHPSSVEIFDYGTTDDGIVYIAMELIRGQDLYALLEQSGALSQARAARLIAEVCDALMVAHEAGIVHRDLKPENIMVVNDATRAEGERVKVLDFGIAKLLLGDTHGAAPGEVSAVTRIGSLIGTPAYMSPEQCGLRDVDTRSDLYTCGVLLFQIVTGRLPFEGETPLQTAMLHVHQDPPRPSEVAPAIDPRLEALISKALSKSPADRHQTALHLASSLRRLIADGLPDEPATRAAIARRSMSSIRPMSSPRITRPVPAPSQEMLDAASRSDAWINLRELIVDEEDRRPRASDAAPRVVVTPPPSESPRPHTEPPPSTDPPARIWSADDRARLGISESGEMAVPVYGETNDEAPPPAPTKPARLPRVDTLRSLPSGTAGAPPAHPAIPPPAQTSASPAAVSREEPAPPSPPPIVIRHNLEPAFRSTPKSRWPLVIVAIAGVVAFGVGLYLLLSR